MRAQRAYVNEYLNVRHDSFVETITDKNVIERIRREKIERVLINHTLYQCKAFTKIFNKMK
jgi:hypothetical protein